MLLLSINQLISIAITPGFWNVDTYSVVVVFFIGSICISHLHVLCAIAQQLHDLSKFSLLPLSPVQSQLQVGVLASLWNLSMMFILVHVRYLECSLNPVI